MNLTIFTILKNSLKSARYSHSFHSRIKPLIVNLSFKKNLYFYSDNIKQLIKYLIVMINYKDYIMDDFIPFRCHFICFNLD